MFSYKKNRNKSPPYLDNQTKRYIPPPMQLKKMEKPTLLGNLMGGLTHGFSFGAGSELAHQGMKKVFTQEQSNQQHSENEFQQELCKQLKNEYDKCILNAGECQALNETLKNICKIK